MWVFVIKMRLIKNIERLKNSEVKNLVDIRIKEFEKAKSSKDEVFKELCFCILAANSTAERCICVHEKIGNKFLTLNENNLQKELKRQL